MNTTESLKLIEQLIEANMAQGGIKNFATLDKLRQAVLILGTAVEDLTVLQKKYLNEPK